MMPWRYITLVVVALGLTIIQVTWVSSWPGPTRFIHLPLLWIVAASARSDWLRGLSLAAVTGITYQLFSALPWWVHPTGFLVASVTASVSRARLVTTRTGLSLLVSVMIGTVMYYLVISVLLLSSKMFNSNAIIPYWPIWITSAAWQIGLHPLLASLWWLTTGQRRAALRLRMSV